MRAVVEEFQRDGREPVAEEDLSPMDRAVQPPRNLRRLLLIGAAAAVVLAAIAVAYTARGTASVSRERLTISTVAPGVFRERIPLTATVIPETTAYLDAIEGGQVAEVLVEEGAFVTAGQPLVRLKNTNLQLEVLGREAQLMEQLDRLNTAILSFEQARLQHQRNLIDTNAQIETLGARLERSRALQSTGAVSVQTIQELTIDLNRQRATHAAMLEAQAIDGRFQREQVTQLREAITATRKNLSLASDTLQSLTVNAPIAGQLTSLEAHLGESKAPGQRIGHIDRVDAFKVEAHVDEFYLGRVAAGQRAIAKIEGTGQPLQLTKVFPQVRDRLFKVEFGFVGPTPRSIRRGQTLQTVMELGEARPALLLANGPFYEETGGQWAFVVAASGDRASRRPVRLGRRNPTHVEVLEGLAAGDRVITSGYETLARFERIRIR